MRKIILAIAASLAIATTAAKEIVLDASVGRPVAGATLFTSQGYISTSSDSKGRYTAPAPEEYPITVRALGFEPLVVETPTDTLRLTPKPYELGEVTVTPATDRNIIYVRAYMREYSTTIVDGDSLRSIVEGNIDYFLADEKVKGFKEARNFRLIYNRARLENLNDGKKEVINYEGVKSRFTPVVDMFAQFPAPIEIPADLRSRRAGSEADKALWGSTRIFTKGPDGYTLTLDPLADKELHDWTPTPLKLLGMTSTFTQLTRSMRFGPAVEGVTHVPSYLFQGMSASMTFVSTGKIVKKAYHTQNPVEVSVFVEIIPYQIDFLTVDEAKRLKKEPVVQRALFVPEAVKKSKE